MNKELIKEKAISLLNNMSDNELSKTYEFINYLLYKNDDNDKTDIEIKRLLNESVSFDFLNNPEENIYSEKDLIEGIK